MKLAEYLARRRRARVAAVMLFALIMGFVSAAPPVVTGCQAQDLTPAPDTSMLSPAVSALAQEQQEPAAQPLPEKWVCLTFDDGPSKTTPDVLSALNAAGVHATFFVVATGYNEKYLPLLTEAVSAGHQIALHSASHEYSDLCCQVTLHLMRRTKVERATHVHQQHHRQLTLLLKHLDKGAMKACRYIPVDISHVIAILVLPYLGKGHASSLEGRMVLTCKDVLAQSASLNLDLPNLL